MEHEQELKDNPRISLAYNNLKKFSKEKKKTIKADSKRFLKEIGIA
jgi:deoxyribodipyrimidine photolyase-like uncharacterized protein